MSRILLPAAVCFVLVCIPKHLPGAERSATPARSLTVLPGFQVELLRSAQPEEGSWISLTFDPQGRLILGEDQAGLLRLTLGKTEAETKVEKLAGTEQLKHCRGVLHAFDALYVCATNTAGFYRLRDQDGDGTYEEIQQLFPLDYRSRYGHGANQITAGPDGKLYLAIGNDVGFPEHDPAHSPYRHHQNDWVLPSPHDGGEDARVGIILQMNPDGSDRRIIAGGLRNQVDVVFNERGDLFTWDADMEWDTGLPWYRPTRFHHIVSGGEAGWRWGTGKWPVWMPDSLSPAVETGLGSPTGLVSGSTSNWPEQFRTALYGADWQHGRILMIDMTPRGASYQGRVSAFLEGSPLNVCDLTFGPDGAMYFITGGRGSQSGLYRATVTDPERAKTGAPQPVVLTPREQEEADSARALRLKLESLHTRQAPDQLDMIWEHLGSPDPWIRFAARVALENQPVESWRKRAATSADSPSRRTALMALARAGGVSDQKIILKGLKEWDWESATRDELVFGLRTLGLTLSRQGTPDQVAIASLLRKLDGLPPSESFSVNWLLTELLVALKSPEAISRTLALLETAATQEEQIQYVKTLVRVDHGWSLSQRKQLLAWMTAHKALHGGKLMKTVLQTFRDDIQANLTPEEKSALSAELAQMNEPVPEDQEPVLITRPLVQTWTLSDLEQDVSTLRPQDRSVEAGRAALRAALCLRCHQFGDRGGQVGPDLTAIGKRFDGRALLESILEPSKVIDPKYHNSMYLLDDGRVIVGRTMSVSRERIGVETDPLTGRFVSVPRAEIVESKSSETSPMPQGLLNTLSRDEILDLIAYLRSGVK